MWKRAGAAAERQGEDEKLHSAHFTIQQSPETYWVRTFAWDQIMPKTVSSLEDTNNLP